jgi:hypothetical protein
MGAYNFVKSLQQCPNCGHTSEFSIQFKYGEVWQYEYVVGDRIVWGKVNVGAKNYKTVVVDGVGEECPICRAFGQDFEVWIEKSKIIRVVLASGMFDFIHNDKTYFVV